MCDKLAKSTTEFGYKSIIRVRRIKNLVKMAEKGVQRVSSKEGDDPQNKNKQKKKPKNKEGDNLEKEDEVEGTIYQCYPFNNLPMVISYPQLPYMPINCWPSRAY